VAGVVVGVVAGGGRWRGTHNGEQGQSDGRRCRIENLGHDEKMAMRLIHFILQSICKPLILNTHIRRYFATKSL
jgi:hypothetical protein